MKKTLVIPSLLLLAGGLVLAAKPVENVNPHKHPNIAAAQELVRQAFEKVNAAQKANEWDMDGHAQKAKELLDQANAELKEAAEAANHHASK
jgi:F0F1-type ATP synthase membrane subunit b/b'